MNKILTREKLFSNLDFYLEEIKKGKLFIYPTDTLHGLGTNAQNGKSIKKIIALKKRTGKSFLLIAPSLEWIFENCIIENEAIKKMLLAKLPGPFSFILKLKNFAAVNSLAINSDSTIGVRLPSGWFSKIIAKSGMPFISTSVNYSGEPSAKNLGDIPQALFDSVDYIIWDNSVSSGKASTIIDVTSGIPVTLRS